MCISVVYSSGYMLDRRIETVCQRKCCDCNTGLGAFFVSKLLVSAVILR